jgi:hypothetical protein
MEFLKRDSSCNVSYIVKYAFLLQLVEIALYNSVLKMTFSFFVRS